MGNLVPSVLLYGQAIELINEIKQAQKEGLVKDTFDMMQKLTEILTQFEENTGKPLLAYESVAETEPPDSRKANRFWSMAQKDVNLLQQQVDILRAAAVFSYNAVSTEVAGARLGNARVNNKLKTLQLYSNSHDSDIITFGDSFDSLEFLDLERIRPSERVGLFHSGHVTLAMKGEIANVAHEAELRILPSSNGFLGNNHEIINPNQATVDPETGDPQYTFKAELADYRQPTHITDAEPNTWIEYERYSLTDSQKQSMNNYNFTYMRNRDDGSTEQVEWATPPPNGVLQLGLEFDFKEQKSINTIEFTPYGLEGNINHPVVVKKIQVSENGTDWTPLFPSNVWVGTEVNLRAARIADNVVSQNALWAFESKAVRYVRVYVEQHHSVQSDIGHPYWVERRNPDRMREGPIPPETQPTRFYSQRVVGDLVQRRKHFVGRRWAIGIRDLLIQQVEFADKSVLVTKPLRVGGPIDRVVLEEADIQVPPEYPEDNVWVKFFISPDDGENWYPISRIEDTYNGIPEQISFNDPLHESLRESSVTNYTTDESVTTLRLKAELTRPANMSTTTPILKSYKLKVRRK